MKAKFLSCLFSLLLISLACDKLKPPQPQLDCAALNAGLVEANLEAVRQQVDPLAADLLPQPTSGDDLGHQQNLQILVDRLNQSCDDYTASILCYACIETFPVQSEIAFALTENGQSVVRIIDLRTAEGEPLTVVGIHDP